jgi:hypothetical protein
MYSADATDRQQVGRCLAAVLPAEHEAALGDAPNVRVPGYRTAAVRFGTAIATHTHGKARRLDGRGHLQTTWRAASRPASALGCVGLPSVCWCPSWMFNLLAAHALLPLLGGGVMRSRDVASFDSVR